MKKNLSLFSALLLCLSLGLSSGCGGDDDPATTASCEAKIDAFEAALDAYIADPSVSKCNAVKSAASTLLACPGLTPGQKSQYQDSVNGIVCD
jgi:hypothetical protein